MLAEGKASSYEEAEIAASLLCLKFSDEESLSAAKQCTSVEAALAFLQQECELCTGRFPMNEVSCPEYKFFYSLQLLSFWWFSGRIQWIILILCNNSGDFGLISSQNRRYSCSGLKLDEKENWNLIVTGLFR